jgi:PAS domain S-box-containing protein
VYYEIQKNGEIQREFTITRQNEVRHYRVRLIPTIFDTMDEGVTIIGEDITQQIRFEESLMISERRYRAIVQDQTDVICRWNPTGQITFVNESLMRFTGISENIVPEANLFSYIVPEDIPLIRTQIPRLTPDQPSLSIEIRLIDHQGTYRWYQWNTRGIFDKAGILAECQSVGRDITVERQQAQKIRESEERFHMITDHFPFPISILDNSGNYLYINTLFTRLFGYTLEDIPTQDHWFQIAFPDISQRREAMLTWKEECAHPMTREVRSCVFPVTSKDGTVRPVSFFQATLQNGEQFVVYEDLTPKKESERLHSVLASIVNSSNDAISLYRNLK